jgi:toxin ParE1/3/4
VDEVSRSIVFRRMAREEFDAAGDWYERCRPGLGQRFLDAVARVLVRITHQPDFYPVEEQGVREAIIAGFPYCLYYREESTQIVVFAVFHASRDPAMWKERLHSDS